MESSKAQHRYFTQQLMEWHETENNRELPWKQEKDPYKIWLSEIILQQTRAQQGLPYYLRFTEAYPTVGALAAAKEEEAYRLWQGLGYYNRCKNMLATARMVTEEYAGRFPPSYDGLLKLKGIGPYTAAAIASFAFGLPHAVVDGNVYRVLARYFGIDIPFDTTVGKIQFAKLANELLDSTDSSAYNQAIMDLGATVCTPAVPKCAVCPLQQKCFAYHNQLTAVLPVRSKKQAVKKRYFHYLLLITADKLWVHKRTGKDIWQNLYQPFLVEHDSILDAQQLSKETVFTAMKQNAEPEYAGASTQKLTHQLIETRFFTCKLKSPVHVPCEGGEWVDFTALKKYGFPKTVVSFLEKNLYF